MPFDSTDFFTMEPDKPEFFAGAKHFMTLPAKPYTNLDSLSDKETAALFAAVIEVRSKFSEMAVILNNGASACQTVSHLHVHSVSLGDVYKATGANFIDSYTASVRPSFFGASSPVPAQHAARTAFHDRHPLSAWLESEQSAASSGHIVIPFETETPGLYQFASECRALLKVHDPKISGWTYIAEGRELHVIPWRDKAPAPHSATNAVRVAGRRRTSFKGKGWTPMTFTQK